MTAGASSRSALDLAPAELRLLGKVARMYHERGIRQPQIASQLGLSQPRVSRLLRQATALGIVRTIVSMPPGVYSDVEERLQSQYNLREAIVVDTVGSNGDVLPGLAAATAHYLDTTLTSKHRVGISSWSESLLRAVEVLPRKQTPAVDEVVQILGGVGDPEVQIQATRLTTRLADLTGATPIFLPAPGFVGTPAARRTLINDVSVQAASKRWPNLTDALLGIGSLEPSPLLRRSGNALAEREQDELRRLGAVGDVCFRFFDQDGVLVPSKLDQRIIGISPAELLAVPRRVGVAGGERKFSAIRAALRGGWVNVIITDLNMGRRLSADP